MTRVFLLDDHELVRRGVRDLLELEADMSVVGEAATVSEALAMVDESPPDVAVLDLRVPGGSGLDVCRHIREHHPEVRCLILTSYEDDTNLFDAITAGADGFIVKDVRGTALVDGIRRVAQGDSLLDPSVTARVFSRLRDAQAADPLSALSEQERTLLVLIGEGLTNREIGARLHLAEQTVKNYVSALLAKLGLQRRTQMAGLAARLQLKAG